MANTLLKCALKKGKIKRANEAAIVCRKNTENKKKMLLKADRGGIKGIVYRRN